MWNRVLFVERSGEMCIRDRANGFGGLFFHEACGHSLEATLSLIHILTTKVTERARLQKAKILAITDRPDTAVAQCADITLTAPTMTRVFLNTLTAPMLMLNLLTSAIKLKQGKTELNDN